MNDINNFIVGENEHLFLDGIELNNVTRYELRHSADDLAEITVTMTVTVNQVDSESEK